MTLRDRQRGTFLGLAVGDALGVAVEFQMPGAFEPVTDYRGGGHWCAGVLGEELRQMRVCRKLEQSTRNHVPKLTVRRRATRIMDLHNPYDGIPKELPEELFTEILKTEV